jgi:branched-chain amino acid transport system substrate-binding protein
MPAEVTVLRRHPPLALALWLLCAAACGAACRQHPPRALVIGEYASMTGVVATFGISQHAGVQLAIDEINARGGVHGRPLSLVTLDDQGKPSEAATAVKKLIHQDEVLAIVGEVSSKICIAGAAKAQKYGVPMISPSCTNPRVTAIGDYIFRVCYIDPFQGTVMASFARRTLGARTAAILRDVKADYSVGLAEFFRASFLEQGGTIVEDQSYQTGDKDFRAQLVSVRGRKPDVLFVPGYYTEAGNIARQAREIGITAPLLGGDGWDSEELCKIAGHDIDGAFFSNHYSKDDPAPRVQDFVRSYRARYGEDPDGMAVTAYDAVLVLENAMKQVDPALADTDRAAYRTALRDAIARTSEFPAVSAPITLDADRNARKAAAVLEVRCPEFRHRETIAP